MGRTTAAMVATVACAIVPGGRPLRGWPAVPAASLRTGPFPVVAWWAGAGRPLPRYERQAAIIGIIVLIIILITIAVAAIHFIRRRR